MAVAQAVRDGHARPIGAAQQPLEPSVLPEPKKGA